MHTLPGLILGENVSYNSEARHAHDKDMCSVAYYVQAYEKCKQNSSWIHYEIQHIPFLLMINYFSPFL